MTITITITGESVPDVQYQLRALLDGMPPKADTDAVDAPATSPISVMPAQMPDTDIAQPATDAAAKFEPEKPRRGRPRKDATAVPSAPVWETRRYGGEVDMEFASEREACDRLVELIHNAGALEALDSLMKANHDLATNIGRKWRELISEAEKRTRAVLSVPLPNTEDEQPSPEEEQASPPAGPPYFDTAGNPLTKISLDSTGSRNAIRAIATGAPPTLGFAVASGLLVKHGLKALREMSDDDPRHATIAAEAAKILGLPTDDGNLLDVNSLFA